MTIKQYKIGKKWEDEVMRRYTKLGFSTIKLSTDLEGTVFDIIAIKGNKATCIECKHTQSNKLYYEGSGLKRKRDEITNFVANGNEVVILINFNDVAKGCITWTEARPIFEEKGYITQDNCIKVNV